MNEILDLLHSDEGFRPYVYDDANGNPIVAGYTVVGNPTIGYGRLLTEKHGISQDEADYLFNNDLQGTITELQRLYPWYQTLDSVRADVVVDMAFNLGMTTFSKFVDTINAIENKDWDKAADEILDSKAARELPERYHHLSNMMRTGER